MLAKIFRVGREIPEVRRAGCSSISEWPRRLTPRSAGHIQATTATTPMVPTPPATTAATRAERRGGGTGSQIRRASLEQAMKVELTSVDAAAHFVGGGELDERVADDDGDVVEDSGEKQGDEGEPEKVGESKDDGGDAEAGDGPEQIASGFLHRRRMRQQHGHEQRADGGGGAEHAQAQRSDMQNILGVHRQERRRAAEQDREHVERHGGQNNFVSPDKMHAGEQRFERHGLARPGRVFELDQGKVQQLHRLKPGVCPVNARVNPGVACDPAPARRDPPMRVSDRGNARHRRPHHVAHFKQARTPRHRVGELPRRNQHRHDRLLRRLIHRAAPRR